MPQPLPGLPSEVWNHVFGYLSAADKFNARASCKYFRKLVDHASLWKDWCVVLRFPQSRPYNSHFWLTLRRRKVSIAVMTSSRAKHWRQLAHSLPTLTTLVVEQSCQRSVEPLKRFVHLKRLTLRSGCSPLTLGASTVPEPQQLTHLSLCEVTFATAAIGGVISALSHFTGLTFLVCHHIGVFEETSLMVRSILRCLPKLKHLSLSVVDKLYTHHSIPGPNPDPSNEPANAPALSSLELIDCMDHSLSEDVMKLMPGLKSLAVFYKHTHHHDWQAPPVCHLKTWLSDLPQLSTLVIVKGPPAERYVASIPSTVTSLTLCVPGLSSKVLVDTAEQVPGLLHFHVAPLTIYLEAHTTQILQLFPKLKSLTLRHDHLQERWCVDLHQLKGVEVHKGPHLFGLTRKLQARTNYRLQVTTSPRRRDALSCSCVAPVLVSVFTKLT